MNFIVGGTQLSRHSGRKKQSGRARSTLSPSSISSGQTKYSELSREGVNRSKTRDIDMIEKKEADFVAVTPYILYFD